MDIYQQLKSAEGQREYVREVLQTGNLKEWEAKEYSALETSYTEQIAGLSALITEYERM